MAIAGAGNRVMISRSAHSFEYAGKHALSTGTGLVAGSGPNQDRTFSVDFARQAEAEAGTDNTKSTTTPRVAQAIAARGGFSNYQIFYSSGTFVVPPGISRIAPFVVGGGRTTTGAIAYGAPGGVDGLATVDLLR